MLNYPVPCDSCGAAMNSPQDVASMDPFHGNGFCVTCTARETLRDGAIAARYARNGKERAARTLAKSAAHAAHVLGH